jgi:hypothetical protein
MIASTAASTSELAWTSPGQPLKGPDRSLLDYFRCSDQWSLFEGAEKLSAEAGYFRFDGTVCYGRCAGASPSPLVSGAVPHVSAGLGSSGRLSLPFDLAEVVTNLRQERYRKNFHNQLERITATNAARRAYYFLRPFLPVNVRKHLQRIRFNGWNTIPFPMWPVDLTVETLMQGVFARILRSQGVDRIPFIWFWPEGAESCVLMTHDVEGDAGREFCPQLMDLDDRYGIKASFQLVPEWLSGASDGLVESLRRRGFEVNLHDLNHDGSLFHDRHKFDQLAARINNYARELGCLGFRSGAMYREQDWYDAFGFSYDMSVPNVAHLEPQRGGCCTVMPYFVGNILELPLTTTQDYTLFHILNDYSTALWERQIELIRSRHGLISFITHPDYLIEARARAVYLDLLAHLSRLRSAGHLWIALPAEIDRWWRSRQLMTLVPDGEGWRVEGPNSHRAQVAYATLDGDRVVYTLDERP